MRGKHFTKAMILLAGLVWLAGSAQPQLVKKDYLTQTEADKIREAETTSERIKLFVSFAADRLQKFHYEVNLKRAERRRAEILNGLLNDYSACVDDAADRILDGLQRQENIRDGIKEFKRRVPGFLEELKKFQASGPELPSYKDTLDDAVEATQEALSDAEKAEKELAPPPVRRKP